MGFLVGAALKLLRYLEVQGLWRHLDFGELLRSLTFRCDIKAPPKSAGLFSVESCTSGNGEDGSGKVCVGVKPSIPAVCACLS